METKITVFNSPKSGDVRTAGTPETPLFCPADVCKALELQAAAVMGRLGKGVISSHPLQTAGGIQQANFVNEDGLYDVILDSRKPEARTFRKWITSEVIPSIRKTGGYSLTNRYLPGFSNPAEAARAWADQYEKTPVENKRALEAEKQVLELSGAVAAMKPKADYCDMVLSSKETVTITQVAQDFGMSAKAFNVLLRNFGIRHKKGRLFLYEELKKRNILPLIERAA